MLYDGFMNQIAYVMVGAPGSGKSTTAAAISKQNNASIVCLDHLREELWGDESIQGSWHELQSLFHKKVSEVAKSGKNIVIDATHARKRHRKETIRLLRENGFSRVFCYIVHPPLETCLAQNKKRSRVVPQRVVIQMWNLIEQNFNSISKDFDNE